MRNKLYIFHLLLLSLSTMQVTSQTTDPAVRINELEQKVLLLEKRVSNLEQALVKSLDPALDSNIAALRMKAKERMKQDYQKYSKKEVLRVEKMYQSAAADITSEKSKSILKKIKEKYSGMNRAGCAALYLASNEEGEQRAEMLTEAFEKFGDCMYGDGVQVGAYARYKLALMFKDKDVSKAKELMHFVRRNFPGAIDHSGKRLEMDLHD